LIKVILSIYEIKALVSKLVVRENRGREKEKAMEVKRASKMANITTKMAKLSRTICVKDAARDLVKGQEHQCQG
jgi:hypothetical protein